MSKWENSAFSTVVYGTLLTSFSSAVITTVAAVWNGRSNVAPLLAGTAALNTGIAATTFFGLREFAISPAIASASISGPAEELASESVTSITSLRAHKIADSAAAGIVTGGILSLWRHGRWRVIPGAITAGLFCATLQFGYNELMLARLRILSQPDKPRMEAQSQASSAPLLERVVMRLGFNRMSDAQYLAVMKKTRDEHLERIRVLEEQIEKERDLDNNP